METSDETPSAMATDRSRDATDGEDGITGFEFASARAGLKKKDGLDLGLIVARHGATAAGLFTRNLVKAAPVLVGADRVRGGRAIAVLVNSGNANACTGAPGYRATLQTTRTVATALGISENLVLPASTGVIGRVLDAGAVDAKIPELVKNLSAGGWPGFADSILTTDRFRKVARARAGSAQVLGIGKGAGMIQPDLGPPHATMLFFIMTDAQVSPAELQRMLARAADATFHRCTVDGDTSTNDTIYALASGSAGPVVGATLQRAITQVADEVSRSMVADGEGAEHRVTLTVTGLPDGDDALRVARTIANSLLVKTALYGKDANWGRILAAAGRAGVPFDPDIADLRIAGIDVVRRGLTLGAEAERRASEAMRAPEYEITVTLGAGPGTSRVVTCDLGHSYIDVNAGYRS